MQVESIYPVPIDPEKGPWKDMSLAAWTALSTAETMVALDAVHLDYGLAVVGYFKAIEITLDEKIFKEFRSQVHLAQEVNAAVESDDCPDTITFSRERAAVTLRQIIQDPRTDLDRKLLLAEGHIRQLSRTRDEYDHGYRLHGYVCDGKTLTLVDMAQILQYLKRVGDETRFGQLWSLKKFIRQHYTKGHWFWSPRKNLAVRLEDVALSDRNPAAHTQVYNRDSALAVRLRILGSRSREGILMSILKALST